MRVFGGGRDREVFTDHTGRYSFDSLPAAEYWLLIRHPGYEGVDLRVVLREGSEVVLDVPLEVQPILVTSVYVPANRAVRHSESAGTADSLLTDVEEKQNSALRSAVPAALRDLVQAESREPSSDPGGAPGRSLNVWGSAAQRGRVLIDGAAINAPLHLGSILPPVESQLLARAELHTAGAPARYDGGTSYIVEYMTRAPADELRAWGEFGLLTSRLGFEAPLGDGSIAAAARRVNDEAVDAVIDGGFEYAYNDALVRGSWKTGPGTSFNVLALNTRETVRIPRDLADDAAEWDNFASVISWGADRPGAGPLFSIAYSRGVVGLPLLSAPDGELEATFDRASFGASQGWVTDNTRFTAGLELEQLWLDRHSSASSDPALPNLPGPVSCTESLPCASADATTAAVYGDIEWQPTRRLSLHGGLRATVESEDNAHLLPRIGLTWLGDGSTTATISETRASSSTITIRSVAGVSASTAARPRDDDAIPPTTLRTSAYPRTSSACEFITICYLRPGVNRSESVPSPPTEGVRLNPQSGQVGPRHWVHSAVRAGPNLDAVPAESQASGIAALETQQGLDVHSRRRGLPEGDLGSAADRSPGLHLPDRRAAGAHLRCRHGNGEAPGRKWFAASRTILRRTADTCR